MILYLTIIFVGMGIVSLFNALFGGMGAFDAVLFTVTSTLVMFAIDALVAWIVHSVPEKRINPFKKVFLIGKGERKLYESIGVRTWKDIIPESGKKLAGFDKRKIAEPNNNEYILKFLRETVYAEIMHFVCIFLSFVPLAFMPYRWTIVLPVACVNAFLQLLPVIVQRYNRIRLVSLYNFNKRHQERTENEQDKAVC